MKTRTRALLALRLIAISVIFAAGCAGVQVPVHKAEAPDSPARVLRSRIEFTDRHLVAIPYSIVEQDSGQRTAFRHITFADPIEVSFHSLGLSVSTPQRLYHLRLKRKYAWLEAGTQQDFAIDLNVLEELIRPTAAPLLAQAGGETLAVSPAETRVARLMLSAGDPFNYPYGEFEAGFIDRRSGLHYVMIYVDRPCRISGVIAAREGTIAADIELSGSGLQWVALEQTGERSFRLFRGEPTGTTAIYVRNYAIDATRP